MPQSDAHIDVETLQSWFVVFVAKIGLQSAKKVATALRTVAPILKPMAKIGLQGMNQMWSSDSDLNISTHLTNPFLHRVLRRSILQVCLRSLDSITLIEGKMKLPKQTQRFMDRHQHDVRKLASAIVDPETKRSVLQFLYSSSQFFDFFY